MRILWIYEGSCYFIFQQIEFKFIEKRFWNVKKFDIVLWGSRVYVEIEMILILSIFGLYNYAIQKI